MTNESARNRSQWTRYIHNLIPTVWSLVMVRDRAGNITNR